MKNLLLALIFLGLVPIMVNGQNISFSGTVTLDGEPVANDSVFFIHNVFSAIDDTSFAITDENGYYFFDEEVEITSEIDSASIWNESCPGYTLYLLEDLNGMVIDFNCQENLSFSGTVTLDGEPVANDQVFFYNYATDAYSYAITDENGYYEFNFGIETDMSVDSSVVMSETCSNSFYYISWYYLDGNVVNFSCEDGETVEPVELHIGVSNGNLYDYYFTSYINAPVASYLWTIEGETYTTPYLAHEFVEAGTYTIVLTVETLFNETYTESVTIDVGEIAPPVVLNIGAIPMNEVESEWYFTSSINATVSSYVWSIDGETYITPSVSHEFDEAGSYTINLTVQTIISESYTASMTINAGEDLTANCLSLFYSIPDSLNDGAVYYVNTSLGTNLSYFWDFGDGNTSTEAYPTHTFSNDTTFYNVCLTITGDDCEEEYCIWVVGSLDGSGKITQGDHVTSTHGLAKSEGFDFIVIPVQPGSVGIKETEANFNLNLFPNPASDQVTLQFDMKIEDDGYICITDLSGKTVFQKQIVAQANTNSVSLSLENFADGIYLIQYRGKVNSSVQKLLLQD